MKKCVASILICMLIITLMCGCARTVAIASVTGYRSEIKLQAVVDDNGLIELSVLHEDETYGIGDYAVAETVRRINEKQSVSVDVVSGATVSSLATIACADQALCKLNDIDIETLRTVPAAEPTEYRQQSCDVVVIGAGGAGLTAAITAAQTGASVFVIEKLGIPGGSTARSEGKIMATGSELQQRFREIDSVTSFASYLYQYSDPEHGSFRHLELAEHAADNLQFLKDQHVVFTDMLETPDTGVKPKRVHQVVAEGETGGGALVKPLVEQAKQMGVEFYYETKATEILKDIDGQILGVLCKTTSGHTLTVMAPAVVIATGGFDRNANILNAHGLAVGLSVSGIGSEGDGLTLARNAGAMLYAQASLIATLEDIDFGLFNTTGLVVDLNGERFANEADDPFAVASALLARGFNTAYLITDAAAYNEAVRKGLDAESVMSADSIEALASKLEMPALQHTAETYNTCCRNKNDDVFQKATKYLGELKNGPYYAVKLSLKSYGTLGGIVTDSHCQVLDASGVKINGLFGAGEVINGAYYTAGFPGYGASLAMVVETGRIAGQEAAAFSRKH